MTRDKRPTTPERPPDVSVLIPVRDPDPPWWRRALRSTLRSRDIAFEVVVVDHGGGLVLPIEDPRIRVVAVDGAVSFAAALEVGRIACQAPFIARMDADDVMHPLRLAAQVAQLEADDTLGAVASRMKILPRQSTKMRGYVSWQNHLLSAADHRRERFIEQPCGHACATFRADALDVVGGYRVRPWPEDYDLYLRLFSAGYGVQKIPVVHHGWRQHEGQRTRDDSTQSRDALTACKVEALARDVDLHQRAIYIVGAGKEGRRVRRALGAINVDVTAFIDADPRKQGRLVHERPVLATTAMTATSLPENAFVIGAVGSSGARGQVRALMETMGCDDGGAKGIVVA